MNKTDSTVTRFALGHFLKTTTLHGFKYLRSKFYIDRLAWVISCFASACCAGVLCAVLWARFLQVPAVLALQDLRATSTPAEYMPRVAVCPPVSSLAGFFLEQGNMNASMINRLARAVSNIISGKSAAEDQLQILEQLLSDQNMTLTGMMLKYSPACEDLIITCRWQNVMVPCKTLFVKELTNTGVCCVMRPDKAYRMLNESVRPPAHIGQIRTLDLSLQCSQEMNHGCKFFAKYDDEANVQTTVLAPGYIYIAQILFKSVPMSSTDELLESNDCITDKRYSKVICLDKCAEKYCGCSDPLRDIEVEERNYLPPCSITQLSCLRGYGNQDVTCKCLPSCSKITSEMGLESATMNLKTFTLDPIYEGLSTKSTVLYMRLNIPLSKIFTLNPTETWLTLLSSLGGVFNMFLGVGLFSALEILFLLVKLSTAFLKSQSH